MLSEAAKLLATAMSHPPDVGWRLRTSPPRHLEETFSHSVDETVSPRRHAAHGVLPTRGAEAGLSRDPDFKLYAAIQTIRCELDGRLLRR